MRRRLIIFLPILILLCFAAMALIYAIDVRRLRLPVGSQPGVSLTYQASSLSGGAIDPSVLVRMARQLEQRADPDGLIDLTFIPLPGDRLEVRLPHPGPGWSAASPLVDEVKQLFLATGILELDVVVEDPELPEVAQLRARLKAKGPASEPGDTMKWVEDANSELSRRGVDALWQDRPFALVYTTPEKSLTPGHGAWRLERAYAARDSVGNPAVGFTFDDQGAALFGQLTESNVGQTLAVVLDDRMLSAATVQGRISKRGIISGGGSGFSTARVSQLVRILNAGSLPAKLSSQPIAERQLVIPRYINLGLRATDLLILAAVGMLLLWLMCILLALATRVGSMVRSRGVDKDRAE